jgi:hypothetical protein
VGEASLVRLRLRVTYILVYCYYEYTNVLVYSYCSHEKRSGRSKPGALASQSHRKDLQLVAGVSMCTLVPVKQVNSLVAGVSMCTLVPVKQVNSLVAGVSICTFVPVKQVNSLVTGVSICTFVPVKQGNSVHRHMFLYSNRLVYSYISD